MRKANWLLPDGGGARHAVGLAWIMKFILAAPFRSFVAQSRFAQTCINQVYLQLL
jgi:hypothetical protein